MTKISQHTHNTGSITLLLLVMLVILILILSASLRLIAQQTHQTVDQQHKLQMVDVADGGVQYATWMMAVDPSKTSEAPIRQTITDATNMPVGEFTLTFPTICSDRLQVLVVAEDSNQAGLCQSVEAVLQQDADDVYRIVKWDQLVNTACTGVSVSSPLVCPTPEPSPTLTPLPT